MDNLLKQYSKLLSNPFHVNYRSRPSLLKILRFRLVQWLLGSFFSPGCYGVLYMVVIEVDMDILLI